MPSRRRARLEPLEVVSVRLAVRRRLQPLGFQLLVVRRRVDLEPKPHLREPRACARAFVARPVCERDRLRERLFGVVEASAPEQRVAEIQELRSARVVPRS